MRDRLPLTEKMQDVLVPFGEEEWRAVEAALATKNGTRDQFPVRGWELAIAKPPRRNERPLRRVRVLLCRRAESVIHEVSRHRSVQ